MRLEQLGEACCDLCPLTRPAPLQPHAWAPLERCRARTPAARHELKDERAEADHMDGHRCRFSCLECGPAARSCGPTHACQGVVRQHWKARSPYNGRRTCGTTLERGTRPALSLFWTRRTLVLAARHHPRSGAVWAPLAVSGHFLALQISNRARAHACVVRCGLRWPRGTYMISARSRAGLESRSRRDRVCDARPPKAVATYLSVRSGSWRYDLRRESYWAARGGANGARPRAHPLWGRAPGEGEIASAQPGAVCATPGSPA